MKLSIAFWNGHIINAGKATHHQPVFGKFPVFIAVGAIPKTRIIVPFVLKTYRNAIASKTPKFFSETVVQFFSPLAVKKFFNSSPAL